MLTVKKNDAVRRCSGHGDHVWRFVVTAATVAAEYQVAELDPDEVSQGSVSREV